VRKLIAGAAGALAVAASLLVAPPAQAGALQVIVTTTDDTLAANATGAPVSLREAIDEANDSPVPMTVQLAADAIYLLKICSLGEDDDTNGAGDLDIFSDFNVVINGNGARIRQTCGGRVLHQQDSSTTLTVNDLTITGGDADDPGGGIYSSGYLFLNRSEVRGNQTTSNGGGVLADGGGDINRSTISGNTAVFRGGGLYSNGSVVVQHSTITQNFAQQSGGGIRAGGPLLTEASTIVANRSLSGANLHALSSATLSFTVLALGSRGEDCVGGSIGSGGYLVGQDGTCGAVNVTDVPDVHPMLGALTNTGGNTATRAPVYPSLVMDIHNPPCFGAQDQRGVTKPQGSRCDTGAVETTYPLTCTQPFPDVPASSTFFDEICWLDRMGITGGFGDGTFRPGQAVTRQSMAAFLHRLAGAPLFLPLDEGTFPDVPASSTFFTEIEWLADEEITGGFPDGDFRPGQPVTRQAMAAFLYRVAGEPPFTDPVAPTFPDVPLDHTFITEIEWLASTGVTGGFPDGTFRPSQAVSRQAMAAFMLRLAQDVTLNGL
jgi:hypothetical protein